MILEFGEVAGSNDKLNLDLVRSVEINCTCTSNSFEGTGFVYWSSRDRVSISPRSLSISFRALKPRSCVDFAEIVCRFCQMIYWSSLEFGSDLKNLHRGRKL